MNHAVLAGIVGLLASGFTATADGPKAPPIDPAARGRLDALIAAYRALPAYADQGEVTLVVKVGDQTLKQVQKASVAFARPDRIDVQTDLVRVVGDGSNVTAVVVPLKTYQTTPSPRKFAESSLRGGPLGAIEFGGVAGLPLVHVLNLVIGQDPERLIYDFTPTILVEPDQVVEGTAYRVLRLDESDNHDWRFLIDPRTGLLAFVDLVVEGDAAKSSIAGGDTHVESLRWSAGVVSTDPRGADAFAFRPPAGYNQVARLEGAARAGAPAHPLIGQPAPDFSIDVLDGPGKTRKLTRADLAGKVVMLDFWATWCPPCLEELPDVQKLIESYGKAKKGVVVVALSIDRNELGDLNEVRAKVEETLAKRKVTLDAPGNAVGLIGLDPLNKVAKDYDAGAIPFVVLIDAQGVVRSVHVGLTDGATFAAEIDALLEKKPITGIEKK
jgi:thiol-disulfide isomerase/thioredoxin